MDNVPIHKKTHLKFSDRSRPNIISDSVILPYKVFGLIFCSIDRLIPRISVVSQSETIIKQLNLSLPM